MTMKRMVTMLLALWVLAASVAWAENITQEEAIELAAQAVHAEMVNDTVPLTDEQYFDVECRYAQNGERYYVEFHTKTLAYGAACAIVSADSGDTQVTRADAVEVNGDTLLRRYEAVYGTSMTWDQAVWVDFDRVMDSMEPSGFEGMLLQQTVYPDASSVAMSMEEAAEIACADSGLSAEDAISHVLIGAQPNPVWKFRVSNPRKNVDKLVEVDAQTGEILDRETYKADNYEFDNPIQLRTLHSLYAPAAIEEYGLEYMSAVEVSKVYGDMNLDDPMLPLLDASLYAIQAQGQEVTFTALTPGNDSYRVRYTDGYLVESVDVLE